MNNKPIKQRPFEKLSSAVTKWTGSTAAFMCALFAIVLWLVTGPLFHFSDTWQLVINTSTTIITFLMVFLIQRSQNKESLSIQIKLNELIASSRYASNRLINIEDLNEEELIALQKYYVELVLLARKERDIHQSHSIDEAVNMHKLKSRVDRKILEEESALKESEKDSR